MVPEDAYKDAVEEEMLGVEKVWKDTMKDSSGPAEVSILEEEHTHQKVELPESDQGLVSFVNVLCMYL